MLKKLKELEPYIGNTPIVKIENDYINLFAKLEYHNLMNNIKARTAYNILKSAIERGDITEQSTVIESSSGNLAVSLAILCKKIGIKFIPVIDSNINPAYENILRILSHQVVKITNRDETGGFLISRLEKVHELCKEIATSYWTNQYENDDNFLAHYEGTGKELAGYFNRLDYAFIGVGTGGTISGISQRLKKTFPQIKVIAVDSEGSLIFQNVPRKRYLPGIGSSIKPSILKHALIDDVIHVEEVRAIEGCHELLNKHSIFAGASSGSVYFAVQEYFQKVHFSTKPNVVFLCPDSGMPYTDTVYNQEWVNWLKIQLQHL
ncbi:2,3-diaminopropionate biosynthesis protein SbnA [Lysinibacillus sp. NPDC056959]|uniref:2,3-diaminopropionate biosynthesis protein SbnA n=1 Tax=Lysinibacillus sp. NPDC056959 TaxID=3345981 RepID=UPI00363C3B52